jgi:hypothetical protein
MSTVALFLDIEKAFHKTWHLSLPYKLSELKFSIILIKLISYFLSQWKFSFGRSWNVYAKRYTRRSATRFRPVPHIARVECVCVCLYKWYAPNTWCLSRSLCWWHVYICDRPQKSYVLRKPQRGLSAIETWCEHWNSVRSSTVLIDSGPLRLILHWTDGISPSPIMQNIFDKRITWRLRTEMTEVKAFRTFIRTYSLFKSERLSANITD